MENEDWSVGDNGVSDNGKLEICWVEFVLIFGRVENEWKMADGWGGRFYYPISTRLFAQWVLLFWF